MALSVESQGSGVALITLDEAAARNAFDLESMQAIADAFTVLLADDDIRAVVLTGTGRFFCAGADINAFRTAIDDGTIGEVVHGLTEILHPLLLELRKSDTVFVAAMNGAAAGGGLGLALAADYRVAAPDAKLAAAFFSLGLSPDGGTTWLLPRLVGSQRARKFFFENETWTGEEALEAGAVDEVAEQEQLVSRAIEVAADWGKWSAVSRRSTKQLLDAQNATFFESQLGLEQALMTAASETPDFAEGVDAFLEKREPDFT